MCSRRHDGPPGVGLCRSDHSRVQAPEPVRVHGAAVRAWYKLAQHKERLHGVLQALHGLHQLVCVCVCATCPAAAQQHTTLLASYRAGADE